MNKHIEISGNIAQKRKTYSQTKETRTKPKTKTIAKDLQIKAINTT